MRPALAYAPGRSPLHRASPGASIAFLGSFAVVAFVYSNPIVLVAAGAAVALAGVAAGAKRAVAASLRLGLTLFVLMVVVNALTYHRGDTVLVRGWDLPVLGNTDITLESLVAGAVIGVRVVVVIMAFAVYSACVDPDRVLRLLRPLARRSAMTAGLVTRMVPMALGDGARLTEASALRGPAAAPVGKGVLARRLVESSLDRAVDVAATLELRGHSLPNRPQLRRERSRDDLPLRLSGLVIVAAAVGGAVAGAADFDTYPTVELDASAVVFGLCAFLIVMALVPFAVRRWRSRG